MIAIATLDTARLRLRPHASTDLSDCVAMWSDPRVTQFIGGKPSTVQQTWSRMLAYSGHWSFVGYGYWVIEDRESGLFLGEIGFADFKRDIAPSMQNVPELGFALKAEAHGKGIATEAARAVLDWGDNVAGFARTVCLINPENAPSLRVVEKVGYSVFDEGDFNGKHTLFLERRRQ